MMGYVEIIPGWDAPNLFAVMDWSESGDSGWTAGTFASRETAIAFAQRYARENRRFLHSAEILPLKVSGA